MQHSTRARARAASTVCEGARDGQTGPVQFQTALQVPPTPGEATGHSEGSLPSAVLRSSVQGSTQVPNSTKPSGENIQVGGIGKEFEPDTGGNTTKKGDEYPKCPPGLCLVRVLEDQHHPYWVR